jgi:hypothetical protein
MRPIVVKIQIVSFVLHFFFTAAAFLLRGVLHFHGQSIVARACQFNICEVQG